MSHRLYDITLYHQGSDREIKKKFVGLNNVVSQLYVHCLNGYKPKNTTRISVTLSDTDGHFFYFGSILTLQRNFDDELFWSLNLIEQKQFLLDTIHSTAIMCSEKYGWDREVFEIAYKAVKEKNFEFKEELTKKASRDRNYKASIVKDVQEDKTVIHVRFYDKQDQFLKEVPLLKSLSNEMFYGSIINNMKWLNKTEFGYFGKLFSVYISVSDFQVKIASGEDSIENRLNSSMAEMTLKYLVIGAKEEGLK
jgi:hypothetical protein